VTTVPPGYGSGSYQLDRERLLGYRRLADIHGDSEVGRRYRERAEEVAARLAAFDRRLD
jgi:hypothetical protein